MLTWLQVVADDLQVVADDLQVVADDLQVDADDLQSVKRERVCYRYLRSVRCL